MLRGTLTALMRSTDTAGVLVVGSLLTLLTWLVTPVWIGSVLVFPPFAVLAPLALAPAFVARGYFVRVLTDAVETGNADGALPFVAWNDLYRDGLKSALLSVILLVPLALLFALVALAGVVVGVGFVDPEPVVRPVETALGDDGVVAIGGLGSGLLAVVSVAYLVAFAYVRPAALAAFAATGRLRDGLRPRRVGSVAASGNYAIAWIVAMVTLSAGYALSAPFVPLLIGVVFIFVTRVVVHALYGRGAVDALDALEAAAIPAATTPETGPSHTVTRRTVSTHTKPGSATERPEDFSKRSRSEAPPAVQAGRTVPLDGGIAIGADGGAVALADTGHSAASDASDTNDTNDADDGGFKWGSNIDDRLESDEAGGAEPGADDDLGFEWESEADDAEDKS